MMKPEFTKQFDMAHARAGAPIGTVGGDAVEILKWKYRASEGVNHILGLIVTSSCEIPSAWKFDGTMPHGYANSAERYLVMLPLGLIDDKPVFVGDKLVGDAGESLPQVVKAFVGITLGDGHLWRWPAPAKVYPVTRMSDDDLWTAQGQADGGGGTVDEFRAIANAALRHAVDAGQVVPKDEHEAALYRLGDQLKGINLGDRAARDTAVAEAVRTAALTCNPTARGYKASEDRNELWGRISSLDLTTIISTVK